MRLEVTFSVPKEDSGQATYIASQFQLCSHFYQFKRPKDFCAQQVSFKDYASINSFFQIMFDKFGDKFIIESLINLTATEKNGGGK